MDSKIFLGKYRVSAEEIGAVGEPTDGALAYEGEEIDSGKTVIVEVVPAAGLKSAMRQKLEAEAEAGKELRHVNIPALYDFGIQDGDLVYVTEDFEGTLAEEWVNMNGPMPVGAVLRIAAQVVSALGAAAFHRLSHQALNPGNIVLVPGQTAEGEWPLIKVLHFVGGTPMFPRTDAGVPAFDKSLHYASPEQIQHGIVDFRSEIYSLGGTMWFLLTGAPPPMVGSIEDKVSTMPKRVGRLLTQMLSASPAERPHDPLAFYRQLQDCLTQVEQRATMARSSKSRPVPVDIPKRRRTPLKTVARAALVLAMAALTALILREYLQHRRVVHAEEPIGVLIGVTDAAPSATPVIAEPDDSMVSIVTKPNSAVAESDAVAALPSATVSIENASTNQVAVAPVQPTASDALASPELPEPAPVPANNASTPPPAIDSSAVALASRVEAAATAAPIAEASPSISPQTEPKKIIMREVRRAEPFEEEPSPEPTPPGEGPAEAAPDATASPSPQRNSGPKTDRSPDGKRETNKKSRKVKETDPEHTVLVKVPRNKSEPTPKSKPREEERIYLPPPAR
jgi:serine/threonine protein kinase